VPPVVSTCDNHLCQLIIFLFNLLRFSILGKISYNRRCLHDIGNTPNPYEQAISIIGRTLSAFDEDNLIPCFGFGDASTHDQEVFSFYPENQPCNGFEEALERYREIVPTLRLAGLFK
jgi:E3 ubiquitin-protein ligase RGLG